MSTELVGGQVNEEPGPEAPRGHLFLWPCGCSARCFWSTSGRASGDTLTVESAGREQ